MIFVYTLKIALAGVKTHKSRSALTVLGIVIGVVAIIAVMAVGRGAEDLILKELQGLGTKTIAVIPGREPSGPSEFAQIFSDSLKEKDLAALTRKQNVPTIAEVMPVVFGGETASYGSETYRLTLFGASDLISQIFDLIPEQGRFFTDEEIRARSDVVVIGSKVKKELFGDSEAMGEKIKIRGRSLRIIGILSKKGQVSFFNFDEMAITPHTTAQQYIFGIKHFHRFIVEAKSEAEIPATVRDIERTLRESHGITDPAKDDFFVQTQADLVSRLGTITGVLTLLLTSVAAISLIVGGIGIMNIMLVSIAERTREIGLRKAVGATEKDILMQFLFEAILLTMTGGFIGIVLGIGLSAAMTVVLSKIIGLGWTFSFPVSAALTGLGVSAAVGVIFGIYPARKASLKDPIEALRYE